MGPSEPPRNTFDDRENMLMFQQDILRSLDAAKEALAKHNRTLFGEDGADGVVWKIRLFQEWQKQQTERDARLMKIWTTIGTTVVGLAIKAVWDLITKN
jgi:hypothetical protein